MEDPSERLSEVVARVQDPSNVHHGDVHFISPFLNGEVLRLDVTRARGWFLLVDHGDGGLVVNKKRRRTVLGESELFKYGSEVDDDLGSENGRKELAFG